MKKLFLALMLALTVAGCTTVSTPPAGGDGIIHQTREFQDLSEQEQRVILEGGGGGE